MTDEEFIEYWLDRFIASGMTDEQIALVCDMMEIYDGRIYTKVYIQRLQNITNRS